MLLHSFTEMNIAACTQKFPIVYTTRYTLCRRQPQFSRHIDGKSGVAHFLFVRL